MSWRAPYQALALDTPFTSSCRAPPRASPAASRLLKLRVEATPISLPSLLQMLELVSRLSSTLALYPFSSCNIRTMIFLNWARTVFFLSFRDSSSTPISVHNCVRSRRPELRRDWRHSNSSIFFNFNDTLALVGFIRSSFLLILLNAGFLTCCFICTYLINRTCDND